MAESAPNSPIEISTDSESSEVSEASNVDTVDQSTAKKRSSVELKQDKYLKAEAETRKAYEEWQSEARATGTAVDALPHISGEPAMNRPSGLASSGPSAFLAPAPRHPLVHGEDRRVLGCSPVHLPRVAIQPPTKGEPMKPPPIVKGVKSTHIKRNSEEVFKIMAKNIARAVWHVMDHHATERSNSDDEEAKASEDGNRGKVSSDQPHEQDLENLLKPEVLRTGAWSPPLEAYTGYVDIQDGNVLDSVIMLNKKMDALNSKMERILAILSLHSVAHISSIKAANEVRMLCLADGRNRDEAYQKLQTSLRAITLASDSDLKVMPFRSLAAIDKFFGKPERIEKAGYFLLTYYDFGKGFARAIVNALLDTDLQYDVFWSPETYHHT